MKPQIYIAPSTKYDFQRELYQPLKDSTLPETYDLFYPHDKTGNPTNSRELIKNYWAVVAEISYPSTGAGIEIGWADAFEVPLIFIHQEDFEPSSYYYDMTEHVLSYEDSEEMVNKLMYSLRSIL